LNCRGFAVSNEVVMNNEMVKVLVGLQEDEKISPLIELVTKLRFERFSAPPYSVHLSVLTVIIYVLMN
jgi:hypothetical protein